MVRKKITMSKHTLTLRRASTVLVLCVSLVAASPAATAATARPQTLLAPPSGSLFGASVQQESGQTRQAAYADLERRLGRKLGIAHKFYNWNAVFPTADERWNLSNGNTPMISWHGTKVSYINSGSQDALIRARADGVKALGKPVFIRWFWEMDHSAAATTVISPADFNAAWRRIRNIFKARGATNVAWVWCPTAYGFTTGRAQTFYPGDANVDWTCADGYNWAPALEGSPWRSFEAIFASYYSWAAARPKPMMIGETGALERLAYEKSNWINATRNTVKYKYGRIAAFVWFDAKVRSYDSALLFDWRLDSSWSSFNAVKAMGSDPYFKP